MDMLYLTYTETCIKQHNSSDDSIIVIYIFICDNKLKM